MSEFTEKGDVVCAPHDWIDVTASGTPPTALCRRCGLQRPIICTPDADADQCQQWRTIYGRFLGGAYSEAYYLPFTVAELRRFIELGEQQTARLTEAKGLLQRALGEIEAAAKAEAQHPDYKIDSDIRSFLASSGGITT